MIKKYLKTFSQKTFEGRIRLFSFHLVSLILALCISLLFTALALEHPGEYCWVSERPFLVVFLYMLSGYTFTFIVDLIAGVGRVGPIFKGKKIDEES